LLARLRLGVAARAAGAIPGVMAQSGAAAHP
jgi:hypothetical protein